MTRKRAKYAVALVACLVSLCSIALAQSATITGTITDPDGGIVKDAFIQATNAATNVVVRGVVSAKGEYRLALPAGTYDLAIAMPCCQYGSSKQSGVMVRVGESRRV